MARKRHSKCRPLLAAPNFCWTELEMSEEERRDCARALVAVIRGLPDAALAAPKALRGGHGAELVQVERPLSYEELDEHFAADAVKRRKAASSGTGKATRRFRPLTAYSLTRRKLRSGPGRVAQTGEVDEPAHGGARPGPRRERQRPGRGGRRPRTSAYTETTATAELRAEIGEPEEISVHGTKLHIWRHSAGRGFNLARLSGQEIQEGETVMGQVHALRRLERDVGLRPAYTVASTQNRGTEDYEDRPDLLFLEDCIRAGEIDWVAVRDLDRLVRADETRARLFNVLRRSNTELYLANLGRAVDLDSEKFHLQVMGSANEFERDMIVSRTQNAIDSRWIGEGKGHTSAPRFGFYRDETTKTWRKDPEQYPVRRWIHMHYHEMGEGASVRQLARDLVETWGEEFEFTSSYLGQILRDPIDVDGTRLVRRYGQLVTTDPVDLGEEAVPADVFQANQERLDQNRGPNRRTPVGYFCLNGIRVIHDRCADKLVERRAARKTYKVQPLLRGATVREGVAPRYRHLPLVPEGCERYTLDADVLEAHVIRQVLRLAGCRTLQEEWRQAQRISVIKQAPLVSADDRRAIETEIAQLEQRRANLERQMIERWKAEPDIVDFDYAKRLLEPTELEIKRARRRLEVAESLPPRHEHAGAVKDPVLRDLARAGEIDTQREARLLEELRQLLTEERPTDPVHLRRRAAIIEASLSAVYIYDRDDGDVDIRLEGPLVPPGARVVRPLDPVHASQWVLEGGGWDATDFTDEDGEEVDEEEVRKFEAREGGGEVADNVRTDDLSEASSTVLTYEEPRRVSNDDSTPMDHREFEEHAFSPAGRSQRASHVSTRRRQTRTSLRQERVRAVEQGWEPAWASPRISIPLSPGCITRLDEVLRSLRVVLDELGPEAELRGASHYRSIAHGREDICSASVVAYRAKQLGLTWDQIVEMARSSG